MNGIVIVDKPQDWTSQDVTARLRRVFGTRRIGHGGTLDPMATGVLPVFVGRATRAVEFFEHAEKTYETVLRLGITTDTEDMTGTVLSQSPVSVTREQLEQTLEQFRGEIFQVPPMYSALKVNGQKLCDLARKGREVERQPRKITIHELTLLGWEDDTLRLRVRCSKGTYIRTLCKDIGQALGCGGCMAELRRTAAGTYTIDQAVPLARLLVPAAGGQPVPPVSGSDPDCQSGKTLPQRHCLLPEPGRWYLPGLQCRRRISHAGQGGVWCYVDYKKLFWSSRTGMTGRAGWENL